MSCQDRIDAIRDHASGGEATAELRAHLDGCAACRQRLEEARAKLALLDRALAAEINVAPPAKATPWIAVAAALVLAVAGWWAFRPAPLPDPDLPSIAAWRSPTAGLLETPNHELLEEPPSFGGYDFLERR